MKLLSQNSLRYGLVLIAVMILCLVLMEITGQNTTFEHSPIAAFSMLVAPLIVLFLGLRAQKKREGRLTYGQGLAEGLRISAVYAILSPFVTLAYYTLINPAILASTREAYMMNDASDSTVIQVDMLIQFASALVLGTVHSAVLSFFLRTRIPKELAKENER